jgi:hypothetical protein
MATEVEARKLLYDTVTLAFLVQESLAPWVVCVRMVAPLSLARQGDY